MVGGSAKPDWDKTTFRVSRIPERLGVEDLSQVLVQTLDVTVTNFSIHSLAFDASDVADAPSKTATVSFRAIPALLRESHDLTDYWNFELPAIAAAKFGHCRISFDTHFDGFTPLSPADHASRPIDCIVVPGWGGHALGSFRSSKSAYVWLRDSLPRHCPELRVWTYGYPSHLTDEKSSADMYEFAERFKMRLRILRQQTKRADEIKPLIFITHSLGGWIFKDAMIQMRKSSNEVDQETILSTYGALFFGVPTQGMDVEAIANMVQNLPARYISTLLDQKDGFRLRQRQHEDFCQAFDYKDSRIVQFFELEKTPTVIQDPKTKEWSRRGPLALLVNPASAAHGRAWETGSDYTFSLAGNHSNMIKFSNDRDDYPTVRNCLQDFTKQAASAVTNRWKISSDGPDHLSSEQQHCLQSLYFSEMDERRNDIEDPANGTCNWLLTNLTYLKWFDQQHGMLWIKGKPGAGKSTLIKHVFRGAEQVRSGDAALASFFFHGRGAPIQKSIIGLFRSILHQLLQQFPELLKEFSCLHRKRTEREGQCGVKWDWHEKELQNFFKVRVAEAAKKRTIRLYIDALDESGENTAVELFDFFQQFGSLLAICFSCRHYPLITLRNGLEIRVEDLNGPDINTYIRSSINTSTLPIGDEIAGKSLGSFQWVALVIRLIRRLHRNGKSVAVLSSKIKQLPSELNELYKELLESLDEEDLSESLLLMQWILFSLRPLKLSELRFALVMGQEAPYTSIRECQRSSWFSETDEDLKRKVLALSRGLVEVRELQTPIELCDDLDDHDSLASTKAVDGDRENESVVERFETNTVVQFIHQSVKDFLLEGALQLLYKGPLQDATRCGHFVISRSCIRYLAMEDVRDWVHTPGPIVLAVPPFLNYAARYWHLHSKEVEKRDPGEADILSMIWRSTDTLTQTWIKVSRMLSLIHGPDFPEAHWSLLHVASRLNLPSVVSTMLEQGLVADTKVPGGRTPLSIAARAGSDEVVRMLLDRHDVEPNSGDDDGCTPFFHAVQSRSRATLMLLLSRENIDLNLQDKLHKSPLYWAFKHWDEGTVRTLLQRITIDADCRGFSREPPLSLAISFGWKAVVKSLLHRKNIDPNATDNFGDPPLLTATRRNCEDIVRVLLDRKDINVRKQDWRGRTPLSYAAEWGREAIVKLLLNRKDVDPNVKDRLGETPLYYAVARNNKDIVQLLLDRYDVDPNVPDNTGITPLFISIRRGNAEIAKMLRDRNGVTGSLGSWNIDMDS